MEQKSFNTLPFKSISEVADESLEYIRKRKDKTIIPLKTRWNKFNKVCCGGIEPNMIITIAGGSGSGKSAFANTLETDLIDLNPDQEIVILSFSYEMLSYRQVGRKLSNKLRKTTAELYSSDQSLSNTEFNKIEEVADKIKKYPIYYIDTPSTVENILNNRIVLTTLLCIIQCVVILQHLMLFFRLATM